MSTFTKGQLIAAACSRIDFAKQMLRENPLPLAKRKWEIELSLSEIALASLEAEHAGFIVKHKVTGKFGSWLHSKADWFRSDEYEVLSAYTAPPAPVVPPEKNDSDYVTDCHGVPSLEDCAHQRGWNECRAAMQGAMQQEETVKSKK
ncbi:hypothetical protein [Escherichia coli]|uniref:hypothetical protein n=1 Tax=Escherichia coli TaxID=562 RepID=UPI0020C7CF30|nr:hypothetical protein [Escherichia coli]EEZ5247445.1 hypothetical protein [Escherichia coli]MCP8818998.1 hypothetical protein [Escherichia coli]MCX3791200.1 hypothetical protein [Escherichia coli]